MYVAYANILPKSEADFPVFAKFKNLEIGPFRRKFMRRNAKLILRLISSILVCLVVFLAFSVSIIRLFGFEVYGVLTGSMEPEYPTGSLIYVKDIDTSSLEVGDTISFKLSENVIATHRIIELVPDENNPSITRYRTKGDANSVADSSLVEVEQIIGKVVFCLPKMGYFLNYIQSPTGITTTVIVSILLVLLVFVSEMLTSDSDNAIFRKVRGFFTGNIQPEPVRSGNRRPPQRRYDDDYYEDYPRQRQRAPRYEDDYPRQRSRYEDDYQPRRGHSSQYQDEYRSSGRSRYEDDYRPQRSRSSQYEDEYRSSSRRSSYDYDYPTRQSRSTQRSRYEDDYQPRRSSTASSQSRYSSSASRSSRYDDYAAPRRTSSASSQSRSSTRTSGSQTTRTRRYSDSDYR